MTKIDQRRIQAIGAQLDSIERDLKKLAELVDRMPAGQLIAFAATLAEHEHRLTNLEANA